MPREVRGDPINAQATRTGYHPGADRRPPAPRPVFRGWGAGAPRRGVDRITADLSRHEEQGIFGYRVWGRFGYHPGEDGRRESLPLRLRLNVHGVEVESQAQRQGLAAAVF